MQKVVLLLIFSLPIPLIIDYFNPFDIAAVCMIIIGGILNIISIFANNGKMPVKLKNEDGEEKKILEHRRHHCLITQETHCSYLGDIIPLGRLTISIGDVFMMIGFFTLYI